MNEQINLRMPEKLLKAARQKAHSKGYGSVQEYIEEIIREDIFEPEIEPVTKAQAALLQRLIDLNKNNSWVSEDELFKEMRAKRAKKLRK